MNLNKRNFLSIKARRRLAASALSVAMGFSIVGSNISTIANIVGSQTSIVKAFADEVSQTDIKKVVNTIKGNIFLMKDGSVYVCGIDSYGELGTGADSTEKNNIKLSISGVEDVFSDLYSTFFKMKDGSIYACGNNSSGQIGLGSTSGVHTPTKVNLSNVISITQGYSATFFKTADGSVYACGENGSGQLGLGSTSDVSTPTKVNLSDVVSIQNNGSTFFKTSDGSIYACGGNSTGQLGLGSTSNVSTPTKVNLSDVVSITQGYSATFFKTSDGSVYVCGENDLGQLGLGSTSNVSTPTKINLSNVVDIFPYGGIFFKTSDGSIYSYSHTKVNLSNVTSIIQPKGSGLTFFILEDGSAYAYGANGRGQLGLGTTSNVSTPTKINLSNITDIVYNNGSTFFKISDGSVYACGENGSGQLGLGSASKPVSTPTKVNVSNIKEIIACYNSFTFFIDENNFIYSTGSNIGQFNDISTSKNTPVNITCYLYYGTTYNIDKIYNMADQSKYGSWFTGFYSKSLYDNNDLMQFILNNTNGTAALSNGGVIQDESQIKNKYFLSDGSMILIDNYGMVQYYKDLTIASPQTLPIDGSGIIGADTIVFGTGSSAVKHPVLYFGSSSKYIDTDGSLKTFTLKKTDIKKMFAYKYSNGVSQNMLIEKSDGSLVYLDADGHQQDFGLNMNDVSYTMPATNVNKDIFVMKDGTLRDDKGTIALPDGVTLSKIWSNRFFEMSDGFLYTLQNGTFKNTNTLAAFAKLAQNNALLLKNGNFQLADTYGNLTNNLDVSGNDVTYMSQLDSTNMYLILNDGTTYGVGTKVQGDSLENHGININDVSSFLSNGADNVTKALVTKDGTVYSNPGSWTKNTLVHFSSDAVNSAHEENPVYTNPGDVIDDYNNSGDPDLVNKLPGGTDERDQIGDGTVPQDSSAPVINITGNPENWTKDDVTLTVNASDEDGGSGFDKIVLPDNSEITTETGTFKVIQNGTYTFKAYDKVGNVTTQTVTVSKIDKTAPGTPTISNDKGTVTITPGTDSESDVKEVDYSIDGGAYQKYTAPFTLEVGSHTVKAKTVDNAENTSSEVSEDITVSVPDKTGPNLNITGNPESWTNEDVTLTVNASDEDGGSGFDKIVLPDNSEITTATDTFKVTQNGTYTFKAYDKVGNVTTQTVTVSKIDKTAPGTPTISNDKGTVTITPGTDSESGVKEVDYSIDGGAYQKYTAPFTLEVGSHIVKARTVDNAGNSSSEVTENITISDTALEEATDAVEHAEDTKKQEDVDHARDLVDALPDSPEKQDLEDRLDAVQDEIDQAAQTEQDLQDANDAVDHAGDTLDQDDLDHAKDLVDNLPDGPEKDELENKVDDIQNQIDNKNQEEQNLAAAIAAVEKAEQTQKQEDVDSARTLVNKLPYGNDRTDLNKRLDAVQNIINLFKDAENRVQIAENVKTASSVNSARTVVNKLPAGDRKDSLNARLDAVENAIELDNTIKAIDKDITDLNNDLDYRLRYNIQIDIESYQDKIDSLRDRVSSLPESVSDKKSEFNSRLDTIQSKLQQKQDVQDAINKVVDALNKADDSLSDEDIQAAQDAIDELPEGVDKTGYNNQLRAIKQKAQAVVAQKISDANAAVTKASRTKSLEDLNKAIELVNALPDCPQKDQLNATINIIKKFAK
jgi:alpha-tubulin suppressor-like RCC1 family protein